MSRSYFRTVANPFPSNPDCSAACDAVATRIAEVRARHAELEQAEAALLARATGGVEVDAHHLMRDAHALRDARLNNLLCELGVVMLKDVAFQTVHRVGVELNASLSAQLDETTARITNLCIEERAALLPGRLELIGRLTHVRDAVANFKATTDSDLWHAENVRAAIGQIVRAELKPPSTPGMVPAVDKQDPPGEKDQTDE